MNVSCKNPIYVVMARKNRCKCLRISQPIDVEVRNASHERWVVHDDDHGLISMLVKLSVEPRVTGRRNRAGGGRRNGASRNGGKAQIRTGLRMRFFDGFGNRVFATSRHWFGLAEALALDHDAIGAVA